jgi:hypothetical protein
MFEHLCKGLTRASPSLVVACVFNVDRDVGHLTFVYIVNVAIKLRKFEEQRSHQALGHFLVQTYFEQSSLKGTLRLAKCQAIV